MKKLIEFKKPLSISEDDLGKKFIYETDSILGCQMEDAVYYRLLDFYNGLNKNE